MLAEDAQQGIVIAGPDLLPLRGLARIGIHAQLFVVVALDPVALPERKQVAHFIELPGHRQQRRGLFAIAPVGNVQIVLRVLEEHPEVVANHVRGDLPAAHRPADKGADEILGVIQHELVPRLGRNSLESLERIGSVICAVTGDGIHRRVTAEEQRTDPRQLRSAEWIGDMSLVHDHVGNRSQAIAEPGTRIIVRPSRRNGVDRLATGRARTHQLVETTASLPFEVQMRDEKVLIQPAANQIAACTGSVEQAFPLVDLHGLGCRRLGRRTRLD